jgi:hypothetical protein
MEIERAVGRVRTPEVHALVLEAQNYVLEMQQQMIDTLRENGRLRERMEKCEPAVRTREMRMPTNAEIAWELGRKMVPTSDDAAMAPFHLAAS